VPTYAYRCRACGLDLDLWQAITDEPATTCPSCQAEQLRRRITPVAITFKGSGFYKTDAA
jgi:putative FmdB family regulatory protein